MDITQRITQRLRNIRQVLVNVQAQIEGTGAAEYFSIEELEIIVYETARTNQRAIEVLSQAKISYAARQENEKALAIAEDRLRDVETIMGGLPILLATDEINASQFLEYICKAPEKFEIALINVESKIFECIRKIVDSANVQRKK